MAEWSLSSHGLTSILSKDVVGGLDRVERKDEDIEMENHERSYNEMGKGIEVKKGSWQLMNLKVVPWN